MLRWLNLAYTENFFLAGLGPAELVHLLLLDDLDATELPNLNA